MLDNWGSVSSQTGSAGPESTQNRTLDRATPIAVAGTDNYAVVVVVVVVGTVAVVVGSRDTREGAPGRALDRYYYY